MRGDRPGRPAPSLDELNSYLDGLGMTWRNWPDRIEISDELPRNSLGKVQRSVLREQIKPLAAELEEDFDGSTLFAQQP